jgi:carbamoyl-phosphate synthase large subunit
MNDHKIMIAGIGGASLGTEIFKALQLAGGYEIYGCDVSPTAYGLYESGFTETYRVDRDDYVTSVMDVCIRTRVRWLLPGGEQPMILLGQASDQLAEAGIRLIGNSKKVVALCSNKKTTFEHLKTVGIKIPHTITVTQVSDIEIVGLPCIVKPSTCSGGSTSVFFAATADEAMIYAEFIRRNKSQPIAQEYVDIQEGEFTIGVLSLPDTSIVSSIALRRTLDAKLSLAYIGRGGIISSGYSQGYVSDYPELCHQAERIAMAIGSRGPINIQGRVRDGILLPFEINPRFSASTYLRALAGFNEVDIFIRYMQSGVKPGTVSIRPGWYLRSLTEQYVAEDHLK